MGKYHETHEQTETFYVLSTGSSCGGRMSLAYKSGSNWFVGGTGSMVPEHEFRLTVKEAKNGIKAISKWYLYKDVKFEIIKFTVKVEQEIV